MSIEDTKTVKSYFRNAPEFGRTTKLVHKTSGVVLAEGMGIATRKQLWAMFQRENAEAVRFNQQM